MVPSLGLQKEAGASQGFSLGHLTMHKDPDFVRGLLNAWKMPIVEVVRGL